MGKYIIKHLNQIKVKLEKKLKRIKQDISDFSNFEKYPIPINIEERLTGRLSTKALQNNFKLKLEIERELSEIEEYLCYME